VRLRTGGLFLTLEEAQILSSAQHAVCGGIESTGRGRGRRLAGGQVHLPPCCQLARFRPGRWGGVGGRGVSGSESGRRMIGGDAMAVDTERRAV